MATYKVIQDVEADDKLIGPFGIRQFIYLLIVALLAYIAFRAGELAWFLALPFLPFIFFFGLLALPFGGSQPTEVWLLAKFRFALKPRKHIWSQDGVRELVTITVPKKIEKHLTNELSQVEVRSRLEALASTIDSRGWSIKHVDTNMFARPVLAGAGAGSDRLIDAGALSGQTPVSDVALTASDDVFDEQNNPTAQNLGRMVSASSKARRDQLVAQMKQASRNADQPPQKPSKDAGPGPGTVLPSPLAITPLTQAMPSAQSPTIPAPQPGLTAFSGKVVKPDSSALQKQPAATTAPKSTPLLSEEELLEKIHAQAAKPKNYGHLHVVKPISEQEAEAAAKKKAEAQAASKPKPPAQPMTPPPDPDIIELANNDDLNVETIARQAKKKKGKEGPPPGEVVIKLH